MALFQPSNITPSSLSGIGAGTVDATSDLVVSWQVNGLSPMTAYQIVIYTNNTASTQVYSTGQVTLGTPFYGTNNLGVQQYYSATITAAALASAGITNGNAYKLLITQWWSATESITQTSASAFITRSAPVIAITAIPDPVTTRTYSVTATYTQEQGDTLSWARWMFANSTNQSNPLDDTGAIETSLLQYDCDGLFAGTTYAIRLIVQTENGVQADTGWVDFDVDYPLSDSGGEVVVCRPAGRNYVQVSWTDSTLLTGEASGAYLVNDGKLAIPAGSSVTWGGGANPVDFAAPWTLVWRGQSLTPTAANTVLQIPTGASSTLSLIVAPTYVSMTIDATTVFSQALTLKTLDQIVVVVTPDNYYIKQVTFTGGTIPSETLYPSEALYPSESTQAINTFTGAITYTQSSLGEVELLGNQICEYVWVCMGTLDSTTIANLIGTTWYEPSFDAETYLIATFLSDDLLARISGSGGDVPSGVTVYRRNANDLLAPLVRIADLESGISSLRDYGCQSQTTYVYYVYPKGETTFASPPFVSSPITPCFWSYLVLELERGTDGAYHVLTELAFANDISTNAISNNNAPNILQNFTPYPLRQGVTPNYKSGSLEAKIGTVDQSTMTYSDTWEQAEKIYDLSVSTAPKVMRDRKGSLRLIETEAAVTMKTGDQYAQQPLTMALPWLEVGSAEGISIIALPGDDVWLIDQITLCTVSLDPTTGILSWTYPDNYAGSALSLNADGNLIQTIPAEAFAAVMEIDTNGNLIATI